MSSGTRSRSPLGPLPRRGKWKARGTIVSLALVLAAGVVSPVAVAAQSMGERVSAASGPGGGGDRCEGVSVLGNTDHCRGRRVRRVRPVPLVRRVPQVRPE